MPPTKTLPHPTREALSQSLHQSLIVSCQSSGLEPLNSPDILAALAHSTVNGGAKGVRLANPESIRAFKQRCPSIPVIGITKPDPLPENPLTEVYITPDWDDMVSIIEAGADIVAMDATLRPRPKDSLEEMIQRCRQEYPHVLLMADVATEDEGFSAESLGFDWLSTTLSGYTADTTTQDPEPDYELLLRLVQFSKCPVILEGRVWTPAQFKRGLDLGAHAVVVGSAITRPHLVVQRFIQEAAGE